MPSGLLLGIFVFVRSFRAHSPRPTSLKGPPRSNILFGVSMEVFKAKNHGALFEDWQRQYGTVYQIPYIMGTKHTILCDPKAIAHFYSKDTFVYRQTPSARFFIGRYFGHNLLWAEAETHKRQRKALLPAFSNAAIRDHTSVFYDSAYMLKASWDSSFQADSSNDSLVIDVQKWLNFVSLDSIGTAGFSHDFGALKGKTSPILAAFDSFGSVKPSLPIMLAFLLSPLFPPLSRIPTKRTAVLKDIENCIKDVANELLTRARAEQEAGVAEGGTDKSIIGALVRSEDASSGLRMSEEETAAQNLLIFAGYETTAISLTWALIELCRNPSVQKKLRAELAEFAADDPSWKQLTNDLHFLDAVVCETLRLHPAAEETIRMAYEDDIIPLDKPTHDIHGHLVNHIVIAKGTVVRIPIMGVNISEAMWGKNAKEFLPERWLDDSASKEKAAEIQGYKHLLTFVDGPRTCLGKGFALTEIKAVLSVLIRNFEFELPDGPTTKIESHRSILARPKIAGQEGPKVPLIVRRID